MAEGLSTAEATRLLGLRTADFDYFQLHVDPPGAAGTANVATENTRKLVAWDTPAANNVTTDALLEWVDVAGSEDFSHYTLWDAVSSGNFGSSGTVTANPVTAGDTFTIAAGDLNLAFSAVAS